MTALLTDNLPLLAGAPNGIKKLRELILELAVRGKLVPQDPNDEPASELLKQIAEEKARLVSEGKIRKQKPLAESGEEAEPFELPAGWKWSSLAQVAFVNPRNAAADSLEVSFVPMTFIGTRFDDQHAQEPRLWGEVKQGFTHFAEGDIGVAKITPCFENSKACVFSNLVNGLGAGTTELHIVRPVSGTLDPRYVLAYLKSPQFLLVGETKMTGTAGQKRLPKDFVEANPFPLPPLSEQHRIVAKVDELMALCDRLEARQADADSAHAQLVQALLDSLTQAPDAGDFAQSWQRLAEHFHTLFTTESSIDALKQTLLQLAVMGKLVPQDPGDEPASELLRQIADEKARLVAEGKLKKQKSSADINEVEKPFALPNSWVWIRLEEIAQVGTGATPLRTNPKYFNPATVSWVTSGETSQDFIREAEQRVSVLALTETNLNVYPPHTLIVAMYGQGKTRGQISELLIDACTNQACAAIQLFDPSEFHRRYVKYFFVKSYDDLRMLAAGGAQPNLNLGKIKESVIPLPPLAEQHRIVAKVDQLMALCDQLKARLSQARQVHEQLASVLVEQAVA
ncbi:restriction endonuclease subunit S [Metapseudomonas otitidis]|uniref:restriction endonuclease subunit S n=1 Tax=Metapseudomonas otitidis TaxID=319939 RepID=UPI0032174FA9